MVAAVVVAEVPLLERDPHHGGEDEEGAEDTHGVGPHAHEYDLVREDVFQIWAGDSNQSF